MPIDCPGSTAVSTRPGVWSTIVGGAILTWLGVVVLVVALRLNWYNSRAGFWFNLALVGLTDLGPILFISGHGVMLCADAYRTGAARRCVSVLLARPALERCRTSAGTDGIESRGLLIAIVLAIWPVRTQVVHVVPARSSNSRMPHPSEGHVLRCATGGVRMMNLIWSAILGLLIGAVAKLLMPGKDPGGIIVTMLIGLAGSMVANVLGSAVGLYAPGQSAGFIMSVLGAMLLLWGYRALRKA